MRPLQQSVVLELIDDGWEREDVECRRADVSAEFCVDDVPRIVDERAMSMILC